MFLTGPKVVKTVTGEDIDQEHLGGASVHATKSGVTHFTAATEEEGLQMLKTLLSYIPSNNMETAPTDDPINRMEDSLNEIIPENPNEAYDMYKVISAITDDHEFFEVQPKFAKNIIVGFARFNGVSVGIVANQPSCYAGVLDVNALVRVPVSYASAMPSIFLSSHWLTFLASCLVRVRSTTPSSCMVLSCSMLTERLPYPRSPLPCVSHTVVHTS